MDDRLYSNICKSEVLEQTVKIPVYETEQQSRTAPENTSKGSLVQIIFSEYLKGIVFICLIITFTLLVPKYFKDSEKIAQEITKKLVRLADVLLSSLCIILLAPFGLLMILMLSVLPNRKIFDRQYWIGENRRETDRRILNIVQSANSRYRDRRRVILPGKIVKLYSFNCDELKENCHNCVLYCIVKNVIRVGLDKIPRLFNIIKGELSFIQVLPLHPLHSKFKDVFSQQQFLKLV